MINLAHLAKTWRTNTHAFAAAVRANPTLAAVSMEGFLTRLGFGMVGFTLPLYALALGMNIAEIGLLYVLRTITTVLVKPVMGWAADRFGRKSTLMLAVALRCLLGLLFVFATQPWHLFAIRILHGAMTAARDPSASALIAEHANPRHMASSFAWYSTARDVGRSLGYAVAGLLIQFTGSYQIAFLIAFLTSCAALFTVIRYVRESKTPEKGAQAESTASAAAVPPSSAPGRLPWAVYRGLLGYAMFGLMVAGSAEMMRGLFPIIATQHAGLTAGQAGLIVGISSIAILVAGPAFGWLSDHVDRKLVLGVRSLANTVSSLLYIALPSFGGYFVARMLDDTGKAAFRPTWGAILAETSAAYPRHRVQVMTFMDTAYTLGEVLGPLAAGLLISGFGVPVMLGVRAALSLVTELQAMRLSGQKRVPVKMGLQRLMLRGQHLLAAARANGRSK
jgi:MFS family permease